MSPDCSLNRDGLVEGSETISQHVREMICRSNVGTNMFMCGISVRSVDPIAEIGLFLFVLS